MAIIKHRHRNNGLLLSELGGYVRPPITDQTFVPEIYVPEDKAGDDRHLRSTGAAHGAHRKDRFHQLSDRAQ